MRALANVVMPGGVEHPQAVAGGLDHATVDVGLAHAPSSLCATSSTVNGCGPRDVPSAAARPRQRRRTASTVTSSCREVSASVASPETSSVSGRSRSSTARSPQLLDALVEVGAAGLDHAVGDEQHDRARLGHGGLGAAGDAGVDPERDAGAGAEGLGAAVGVHDDRGHVAGDAELELAGAGVEQGGDRGDELFGCVADQQLVGEREQVAGRRVDGDQAAQAGTDPDHRGRGEHPSAHHVADDHRERVRRAC